MKALIWDAFKIYSAVMLFVVLAFGLTGCEKRQANEPPRGDIFHLGTPACGGGDVCKG